MQTPQIIFAVEVGAAFGLGHMMRCRVLASELARRGRRLAVAVRGDLAALDRWPWPGEALVTGLRSSAEDAAADVLALAREHQPDWVVIDGYGLTATPLLTELRRHGHRTLAFDDLADAPVAADIVLNQNMTEAARYGTGARLLLGPRYALVAEDYRAARRTSDEPSRIQQVLVSFGGADRKGVTTEVLRSLATAGARIGGIDVVAGPYHAESQAAVAADLPVRYHHAPSSLASLMASADVVISAAGSGCWEVCCVGRPAIAVQTAANQRRVLATLQRAGAAVTLDCTGGLGFSEDGFMAAWRSIRDQQSRQRLSSAARDLVDGLGAARVADALGC